MNLTHYARKPSTYLEFRTKEIEDERFKKAFIGVVFIPIMSYNIQTIFEMKVYFYNQGNTVRGKPLFVIISCY